MVLQVERRDVQIGKNQTKKLRRLGMIPGNLYQEGESIPIKVNTKNLNDIIKKYGESGIFEFIFEKKRATSLIKEIQRDPVNQEIIHFDLQPISRKQKIKMSIPIQLEGQGIIESKGGVIQRQLNDIEVEAYPDQIPQSIQVDLSQLDVGDNLYVKDIKVFNGIEILSNPEEIILSIAEPATQEENLQENEEITEE
ncbi:50S ribosomal protein L25 [Garciella nitratireducens]|uniref:Large ribosomal subunit protein bL25 n=1 Tax=Garciella nitratireducens DSM 15102 TaxID=1121911 RepID=A0A1T4K2P9_9FIRM|nr:50S ribosomal protein L25 [Garciella nitratireducens]SJZ36711.1 large subunit ribosomal protein L25 [Garciella nitratireducens DSM 15102]